LRSLEHVLETLKRVEPGSFLSDDKVSFALDASLNEARAFLVELIDDQGSSGRLVTLAHKVILAMGLARSNVEDLLVLCSLLSRPKADVDLRDELQFLKDVDEQEFRVVDQDEDFEPGEVREIGEEVTMPLCSAGGDGIKV